jgi:preprotein translocase subunit SecB
MLGIDAAQNAKDKRRYRLELQITSGDEKENALPYHFDITLVGFFRLTRIRSTTQIEPFITRDAAAILYSAARELLASITGRGPFPAIVLPVILFDLTEDLTPPKPKQIPSKASKRTRKKR